MHTGAHTRRPSEDTAQTQCRGSAAHTSERRTNAGVATHGTRGDACDPPGVLERGSVAAASVLEHAARQHTRRRARAHAHTRTRACTRMRAHVHTRAALARRREPAERAARVPATFGAACGEPRRARARARGHASPPRAYAHTRACRAAAPARTARARVRVPANASTSMRRRRWRRRRTHHSHTHHECNLAKFPSHTAVIASWIGSCERERPRRPRPAKRCAMRRNGFGYYSFALLSVHRN
jgi:hypothetical protein